MVNRKYFLAIVLAAVISLLFIILYMIYESSPTVVPEQETTHSVAPFKSYIFGTGIVEASSENIAIGTPLNRAIEKIDVNVGDRVKKGEVLLQLENRDLRTELLAKRIDLKKTQANLEKLESYPRREDLIAAEAQYKTAQFDYELAKKQNEMIQSLKDPRALSKDEINRRQTAFEQTEAKLQQAQADFDKIKAGTWKPDLEIAKLEVMQARASLDLVKREIERTIIRSPIDATVLQIKAHEGEFPQLDTSREPLMVLGNTDKMHLRVSINQFDIPYFDENAPAVAFLQGDQTREFPLTFIRVEPFLIGKQNLTNAITEKVDTRVLQVIYSFKTNPRVYVGQQMDVFIETD
jgi:multidrug efflux pump subunit AcrA (membrane-fusion protein)